MSDDWLDTTPDVETPGLPVGPQAIVAAATAAEKRAQFLCSWGGLTDKQKVFLNTWRECRFNANKAIRLLANTTHHTSKTTVVNWGADPNFEHARTVLRDASVEEILSRSNLATRHDDIVEEALTPKPILHQGAPTGFEEVELGTAAKANETLLRLGGHLKDKDIDVNVGIIGPQFTIQVVQADGSVIDATPKGVTIDLPEADWTDES